jgi:hypothetical protein
MTVTLEAVRALIGIPSTVLPDAQLQEDLDMAEEYCRGYMQSKGKSSGGPSYDSAVKWFSLINARQTLDIMGIKPDSLATAGITMSTSLSATTAQLEAMGQKALNSAAMSGAGIDQWVRHIRSGKTSGRYR